ncbi:hypothetical protein BX667DRAFT_497240 [Coemansia mojavensis]|nr:hypothetical protein BX667DRAFT_497240 [Coemansia mojavensis]
MSGPSFAEFDNEWSKIFQLLAQSTSIQPAPMSMSQQDMEMCTLPLQPQPIVDNGIIQPAQQQFLLPSNNRPLATAHSFKPKEPTIEEINQTLSRYKKYLPKTSNGQYKYRAYNSYMIYRLENIKKYKNKRMSAEDITKSISRSWRSLSSIEKESYEVASRNLQVYLNWQKAKNTQKQNKRKRGDSDEDIKECPILCGEDTEEMTVGVLEPLDPK